MNIQNKPLRICLLFILLTVTGCGVPSKQSKAEGIYNSGLREAYAVYDQTMSIKRTPLLFTSGRVVDNGTDYVQELMVSTVDDVTSNYLIHSEYLICLSVYLIRCAARNAAYNYAPSSFGKELFHRLDLRSFPSSIGDLTDGEKWTLKTLALKWMPFDIRQYVVYSDNDEWFLNLEVVANVDINGDGTSDWIVWLTDEAKHGSYGAYHTIVIYSPSQQGPLLACNANKALKCIQHKRGVY